MASLLQIVEMHLPVLEIIPQVVSKMADQMVMSVLMTGIIAVSHHIVVVMK